MQRQKSTSSEQASLCRQSPHLAHGEEVPTQYEALGRSIELIQVGCILYINHLFLLVQNHTEQVRFWHLRGSGIFSHRELQVQFPLSCCLWEIVSSSMRRRMLIGNIGVANFFGVIDYIGCVLALLIFSNSNFNGNVEVELGVEDIHFGSDRTSRSVAQN